jgi:hypothetical protein
MFLANAYNHESLEALKDGAESIAIVIIGTGKISLY